MEAKFDKKVLKAVTDECVVRGTTPDNTKTIKVFVWSNMMPLGQCGIFECTE